MSLLGLDIGTTGCKAAVFSLQGELLAGSYEEYDIQRMADGWAELNAQAIWNTVQNAILSCTQKVKHDPVTALAVSSLGEAVVPVSVAREILGSSILNMDIRGEEYLPVVTQKISNEELYKINGNTIGNQYSLTKLLWIKHHQPDLYHRTYKFLHWSGFISFMLGADPVVDYSLANRSLLFDINQRTWSSHLLDLFGIDPEKLPRVVPSGTIIGQVSRTMSSKLGLRPDTLIIAGAHDQCANAVGSGVIHEGQAMFGMGTFFCVAPVYTNRRDTNSMIKLGLNTEHHAIPNAFVSFIYNQGGSILKWYRDTFAIMDHQLAKQDHADIYARLIEEIPAEPAKVIVLPHFTPTGPPNFIDSTAGVIVGLYLTTKRGDILKGIMEGTVFYIYQCMRSLEDVNISLTSLRAVGGGSKSMKWLQICSDITGLPIERPANTEAGALGAAIIAGVGSGLYSSYEEGCKNCITIDSFFSPDLDRHQLYQVQFSKYQELYPILQDYLKLF